MGAALAGSARGVLQEAGMNPLGYLKAVLAAGGAVSVPPIVNWAVTAIPAPDNVRTGIATLLILIIIGPAVYHVPNIQKGP